MSNICRIDQLGMNLLDEITDYLDPVDIVSIFGVNKGLYKLWGSRITRKILKNENFAVDWDLKKLWKVYQLKHSAYDVDMCFTVKRVWSNKRIYVLDIKDDPLELSLLLNNNFTTWNPAKNTQIIIDLPSSPNYSILTISFGHNFLAILYTNSIFRLISLLNSQFTDLCLEDLEINYLQITNILVLNCQVLVFMFGNGDLIYLKHNGEIISKRNLGLITKFEIIRSRDAILTSLGDCLVLIFPESVQLLCILRGYNNTVRFWYDKEIKKIVVHYNSESLLVKSYHDCLVIKCIPGTMWYTSGHYFLSNVYYKLKNLNLNLAYSLHNEPVEVFGDKLLTLAHIIDETKKSRIYLYLCDQSSPIFTRFFKSRVEILRFLFPYLIYSFTRDDGIAEINIVKF